MSRLSIADMLAMYSKESDDVEGVEGVEEQDEASVVEVAEDTESEEIEDAVEEGEEVVEEGKRIDESAEALLDATESLESSVAFITALRDRGESLTAASVNMWSKGVVASMEARGIPAALFDSELVGFGDSFESDNFSDYSVEAEAKGEGILKRLWNMIKAAFARLLQWVTRFVGWFRTSSKAVRKAAEKLKSSADKASSEKLVAGDRKVNLAPFSDLAMGGRLDVDAAVMALNAAVITSMDTATTLAESVKKESDNFAKADGFFTKMIPSFLRDLKTTAEKYANSRDIAVLPGGRKITAYGDKGKRMNFFGSERFTFKLLVEKDKSAKKLTGLGAPLTLREISALGSNLIDLVDRSEAAFKKFEDQFGKVKLQATAIKISGSKEEAKDARKAAQLIQSTMLAAQRIPSAIAPIVFPIAKRAYLYGKVSLNQYKKAK